VSEAVKLRLSVGVLLSVVDGDCVSVAVSDCDSVRVLLIVDDNVEVGVSDELIVIEAETVCDAVELSDSLVVTLRLELTVLDAVVVIDVEPDLVSVTASEKDVLREAL
jgi:hypothetical protein